MNKFENINEFFNYNLEIKKLLHNLVPNDMDAYNNDSIIKYSDKLFEGLKIMRYYFARISSGFCPEKVKFVNDMFNKYEESLLEAGYDFNKLKNFYKNNLSDMSPEYINKINLECKGYTFNSSSLIKESKTINEMLHFLHHYIMNDERFYESIPKIESKTVCSGEDVTLRGMESDISKKIFDMIPDSLPLGITDIISLPKHNKVLMMVRDYGHALTIEATVEDDVAKITYFIPKVCNYDMINGLKGVKKVSQGDRFTVGYFETSIDKLPFEVVDFISKVPTDDHMFIEGGTSYNPEYDKIY